MPNYPRHLRYFDYIGPHRYFLTFCCYQRAPHFADGAVVDIVHARILRAARRERFVVLAYCYMPDHVHLLAQGDASTSSLKTFIVDAKGFAAWEVRRLTSRRLWQRYGYERVLRHEETSVAVIRYIINNPLRAGLVADVFAYRFWGSAICSREELAGFAQGRHEVGPYDGPT